jgi:hypothetical protein
MKQSPSWKTQPVKKYPLFYETWRFITVFTKARHQPLSWARWIQSKPPTPLSPKIHFNIILPPKPKPSEWSLPFRLSNRNFVRISRPSHASYMSRPSHPSSFDHPNNIRWRVQTMNLLIMKFFLASRHFIPLWFKYSPKHPVLKHLQSVLFT